MKDTNQVLRDPSKDKPLSVSPKDYKPISNYKETFTHSEKEKAKLKKLKKEWNKSEAPKIEINSITSTGYKRKIQI